MTAIIWPSDLCNGDALRYMCNVIWWTLGFNALTSYRVINNEETRFVVYVTEFRWVIEEKRLRWSSGSVLAFSTQVRGFKPGRSRRIFKGEKILSTPSFEGEVKPSVPCRRFAACKRSLNGVEVVISAKLPDNLLTHSFKFRRWDLSRRGGRGEKWEHLKSGGKKWQATPKNLHRMQRTRVIPVDWLSSGLCPDRPKGWITIIIIIMI